MAKIEVDFETYAASLQKGFNYLSELTNYMDQLGEILKLYQTGEVTEEQAEAMVNEIEAKGDETMAQFERLEKTVGMLNAFDGAETEDE